MRSYKTTSTVDRLQMKRLVTRRCRCERAAYLGICKYTEHRYKP